MGGPRRIAWTAGVALGLALAGPGAAAADVFAGFSPSTITVAPGDTFTVEVVLQQAGAELNAFDASVRFDPARLSFVPTSPLSSQRGPLMTNACANTFHLFNAAPDSLKITLSLLCNNTFVTGPGVIYRVRFVAGTTTGSTPLTLGAFTEFYRAGLFVRPLFKQSMTVNIVQGVAVEPAPSGGNRLDLAPPAPNPARGGGAMALEFTLPEADEVSFDLLDLQGRRLAERDGERHPAGRHRLSWRPPVVASGDYFVRLRTGSGRSVVRRWAVLR